MTLSEFRNTELGGDIKTALDQLKNRHHYSYDTSNLQAAIFFSYACINDKLARTLYESRISSYVLHYHDVMRHILLNQMGVKDTDFDNWVRVGGFRENMLELSQQCGLATPTYASNKNAIH